MFCKNCGSELEDGDKFCKSCGMPVQTEDQTQPQANIQPVHRYRKNTGWIVGVISALGLIVIIVLFIAVMEKSIQATEQKNNSLTSPYRSWQEDDESDDGEYDTEDNDLEDFF